MSQNSISTLLIRSLHFCTSAALNARCMSVSLQFVYSLILQLQQFSNAGFFLDLCAVQLCPIVIWEFPDPIQCLLPHEDIFSTAMLCNSESSLWPLSLSQVYRTDTESCCIHIQCLFWTLWCPTSCLVVRTLAIQVQRLLFRILIRLLDVHHFVLQHLTNLWFNVLPINGST